jgi:hypothetical protein
VLGAGADQEQVGGDVLDLVVLFRASSGLDINRKSVYNKSSYVEVS